MKYFISESFRVKQKKKLVILKIIKVQERFVVKERFIDIIYKNKYSITKMIYFVHLPLFIRR